MHLFSQENVFQIQDVESVWWRNIRKWRYIVEFLFQLMHLVAGPAGISLYFPIISLCQPPYMLRTNVVQNSKQLDFIAQFTSDNWHRGKNNVVADTLSRAFIQDSINLAPIQLNSSSLNEAQSWSVIAANLKKSFFRENFRSKSRRVTFGRNSTLVRKFHW